MTDDKNTKKAPKTKKHPLKSASIVSRLLFGWLREVISISRFNPWEQTMHYDLPDSDKVSFHKPKLKQAIINKKGIFLSIFSVYKKQILGYIFMAIIVTSIRYSLTFFSTRAMEVIQKREDPHRPEIMKKLIFNFGMMAFVGVFSNIIDSYIQFKAARVSVSIRASIYSLLQDKIMKFSLLNSLQHTEGFVTNLLQVDAVVIEQLLYQIYLLLQRTIGVIVGTVYMGYIVGGVQTLVILAVFFGFNLFYGIVYYYRGMIITRYLRAKDTRMTFFKNVLDNIEFIKTKALENYYSFRMFGKRKKEIKHLRETSFILSCGTFLDWATFSTAIFVTMLFFINHKSPNDMTYVEFFAFIQLFKAIKSSLTPLLNQYMFFVRFKISVNRLNKFFVSKDRDRSFVKQIQEPTTDIALKIKNGYFQWKEKLESPESAQDKKDLQTQNDKDGAESALTKDLVCQEPSDLKPDKKNDFLLNIDHLEIKKGEKIAIIGRSSSGKSSLLYSLLGEMVPIEDNFEHIKVFRNGSTAFLSQERWIVGGSIKENIILGNVYDEELMTQVLEASQLSQDLLNLENRLETELDEAGDNISGGQKARIGLARCFYQNSDILLLDDPTSSLDNKVSMIIMNSLIHSEPWSKKTVVFTTNNIRLLDFADKIILMDNGKIELFDTYLNLQNSAVFTNFVESAKKDQNDEDEFKPKPTPTPPPQEYTEINCTIPRESSFHEDMAFAPKEKFLVQEDRIEGNIPLKVFIRVFKGLGGWFTVFVCMIGFTWVSTYGAFRLDKVSLAWGDTFFNKHEDAHPEAFEYLKWIIIASSFGFLKSISFYLGSCWLCLVLHSRMFFRLLHGKVTEFFQRVPTGIILNRFSNDINTMDYLFGSTFHYLTLYALTVVTDIYAVIQGMNNVYALIPCVIYILVGFKIRVWYMNAQREMTRLDAMTKSPVIGLGSSCLKGGAVIRSMGNQQYLQRRMIKFIHENSKNAIMIRGLTPWFSIMMRLSNLLFLLIPCYSLLIFDLYRKHGQKGGSDPKDVAFFILKVVGLASHYITALTRVCDLEIVMISAERCVSYEQIEPEEGYKTFERDTKWFELPRKTKLVKKAMTKIDKDRAENPIFSTGKIVFQNVEAYYPANKNPVLKNLNLNISSGQKIGIVGRTGAGKSSFIKLLWRALIPRSGQISIDGINIQDLDLKKYRKEITIITQKPNLFSGTILSNITQRKIGDSTKRILEDHLRDLGFPEAKLDLNYKIEPNGSNLSQSEKQIICLMQSLLTNSKIVILDEATAYIDQKLEEKFQKKIWDNFAESTVFVIAHRISNVLNCDRILVFDNGEIVEDGTVEELIGDKTGFFYDVYSKM